MWLSACLMCYMFVAFHLLCDDFFVPGPNKLHQTPPPAVPPADPAR